MRIHILASVVAVVTLGLIWQAPPGGAVSPADEVWNLGFESDIVGHSETTGVTVLLSSDGSTRSIHGVDPTGRLAWTYRYSEDATQTNLHGLAVGPSLVYLSLGPVSGAGSTVLAIDSNSGSIVDEWQLEGRLRDLKLTDRLWFTYSPPTGDRTIGFLVPADGTLETAAVAVDGWDITLLDVASDNLTVFAALAYQTVRWDLSGASAVETHRRDGTKFVLSEDGTMGFRSLGDQLLILDPSTLETSETIEGERNDFGRILELEDGRLLSVRTGPRDEPLVTLVDSEAPRTILGRGLSFLNGGGSGAVLIGDRLAWTSSNMTQIRLHELDVHLDLSRVGVIEAARPFEITTGGDFLATVEALTIDGREVDYTINPATTPPGTYFRSATITIRNGGLTAGTHRVVMSSSLGSTAAQLEVIDGPDRQRLDLTLRGESSVDSVLVWLTCHPPTGLPTTDTRLDSAVLRRGTTISVEPVPGHRCRVMAERRDLTTGGEHHLTVGFYDPTRDPTGSTALDLDSALDLDFTMTDRALGISLFAPDPNEQVLWLYAYGVGTPTNDQRNARLECPQADSARVVPLHYGNFSRHIVPSDPSCLLVHRTPNGATVSGFGSYEPNGSGRFEPPRQPSETTYFGAGQTTSLVVIYNIYPHPTESNDAFVMQQYRDFLGRDGEASGRQFWLSALDDGSRRRANLVELFLDGPEFGGTVAPVDRLYRAYFDRAPDRSGLFFWADWMRSGRSLAAVSDEFAASAEFRRTYGALTDEEFIDLVYRNVLGRGADGAGRQFWINRMAGGMTRGEIMLNFSESAEYVEATRGDVLVGSLYQGLLRRSPDPGGLEYWKAQVESGRSVDALIDGILSSDEYYNRFVDIYERPDLD